MFCIDFLLFSFPFFFLKKEVKKRKLPIQPEATLSLFDFSLVQIPYVPIYLILPTVQVPR